MAAKIPFALLPIPLLEKIYRPFQPIGSLLENTIFLNFNLKLQQAKIDMTAKKYLSMSFINDFIASGLIGFMVGLFSTKMKDAPVGPIEIGIITFIFMMMFMLFQQKGAPEMYIKKRIEDIERNTLPALQNILIQLRAGIPLFDIFVNVAASDYGEVSKEFMKVVKKINGGIPQVEALERMSLENPSNVFRTAIWQMVNGMKTGTNLSNILREVMNSLSEQQLIQVEEYGATLSPLSMFYMIMAVILPAIGVNFLIVIAAFMGLETGATQGIFWGVYGLIFMTQFVFMNIIKTKRPSMLKE